MTTRPLVAGPVLLTGGALLLAAACQRPLPAVPPPPGPPAPDMAVVDTGAGVRLSAGPFRLAITAAGGRVLEYSYGGTNVLRDTGPAVQRGASFWLAPQDRWPRRWPPPAGLERTPYAYDAAAGPAGATARFRSPPLPELGVRITKSFHLTATGTFHIRYAVTALTASVEWAPWEVSRHGPGTVSYGPPRPAGSAAAAATGPVPGRKPAPTIPTSTRPHNHAHWADTAGWAVYRRASDGMELRKRFPDLAPVAFPAGKGDLKVWHQGTEFLEFEPMGELRRLAPGETMVYDVVWRLRAPAAPAAETP